MLPTVDQFVAAKVFMEMAGARLFTGQVVGHNLLVQLDTQYAPLILRTARIWKRC